MTKISEQGSSSRQLISLSPKKPKPHFFTVIINPRLQLQQLEIPREFVRKHGKDLTDVAFLKVPSGEDWKVKLLKSNGRAWVYEGWEGFVEFYSVEKGYFVVFKYEGNSHLGKSHFHVVILDISATEIEYKIKEPGSLQVAIKNETSEQQDDGLLPGKEMVWYAAGEVRRNRLSTDEKDRVLERARAYTKGNPSFVVKLQPSHVTNKCTMYIPIPFVREHLDKRHKTRLILRTLSGKAWMVNYSRGPKDAYIRGSGWKEFMGDNELKVDNVCVFELIENDDDDDGSEDSLRVVIFRGAGNGHE